MQVLCAAGAVLAVVFSLGILVSRRQTRFAKPLALMLGAMAAILASEALRGSAGIPGTGIGPAAPLTLWALVGGCLLRLFLLAADLSSRGFLACAWGLAVPAVLRDILVFGWGIEGWLPWVLHGLVGVQLLGFGAGTAVYLVHIYALKSRPAWMVWGWSLLITLCLLLSLLGNATGMSVFLDAADAASCAALFAGAILSFRYPDILARFQEEAVRRRYPRPLGFDVGEMKAGLDEVMRRKTPYRDEEFSLEDLARLAGLTRHQTSQLLNEHLGESFSSYVNRHRVADVQKTLAEHPETPILRAALDAGFGNKTSFNEAFRKFAGTTPKEFRSSVRNDRS